MKTLSLVIISMIFFVGLVVTTKITAGLFFTLIFLLLGRQSTRLFKLGKL